jgi:hypothetical protein
MFYIAKRLIFFYNRSLRGKQLEIIKKYAALVDKEYADNE